MPRQLKKQILIDTELLNWIEENYPPGAMQWIVNSLLRNLMEVTFEKNPRDMNRLAALTTYEENND